MAGLSRDAAHAANGLSPLFDKEKEQQRLQLAQSVGALGGQVMEVVRTAGDIRATQAAGGQVAKPDESTLKTEEEKEKAWDSYRKALTDTAAYKAVMASYGTGSDVQRGLQAATAALQALAGGGNLQQALAGASAPYLAQLVKQATMPADEKNATASDIAANAMGHALVGAVVAQVSGRDAVAGAAGAAGGELAARLLIMQALYPGRDGNTLTETEKQSVSALASVAAGLAAGIASGSVDGAATGVQAGRNAVENNFLSSDMYSLDRKVKAAKEKGEDIAPILEAARKQAEKDREKQIASCQDNPDTCAFGRDVANDAYNAYLENGFLQGIDSDVARFVQQETAKDNAVIDQYASEFGKGMAVASEGAAWLAGAGVGVALPGKAGGSARDSKLSQSKINEIVNTPKGQRPEPSTYMSKAEIDSHLAKFDDGAVRFASMDDVKKYGTLGPDSGFVMPKSEFDKLIKESSGNLRVVEQKLGLESGYLGNSNTGIFYIQKQDLKNLKIPSGNEPGANQFWLPGGKTSGGISEAVMDFSHKPNAQLIDLNKYNGGK
ncbi:VENN motif pre-toxin domain-containing protein [Dickeya aquatica]|uniref:VENN motif-containing domain-containing protein n=1 Tax=Dickeya aquatica TaxID=1401087 RepID=A0A375ABA9_9GAMM|nr:VENN motif pre-toxin domain-containing protein [Dickeya aquatica]SLM63231.1 hypothetical protein DAQ1742_02340 [Dickeya aquatica]